MFRVLCYLVLVILIGSGFAWLANNPIDIILPFAGQRVVIPLLLAVSTLLILLIILAFIWWLLRLILRSPFAFNDKIKESRKQRGEDALTQGLLAALSGDRAGAAHFSARTNKLLDNGEKPLQQFLTARSLLLNDDREGAVRLYEDMRKNPQTKLIALQGLYQEAIKSGAYEAAGQYAEEAAELVPTLKWANRAVLDKYAVDNEWEKALSLFERMEKALPKPQRSTHKQKHLRAVLLTGEAMTYAENKPDDARTAALKAVKLDRDFVPTATVASEILFRLHEVRGGEKTIESLWRREPHPDLARAYINAIPGEPAVNRLKRAKKLASLNPNHFESLMIVARTAFEAGELAFARESAEKAIKQDQRESAFLLLADIEENQSGDLGRVRQWLARAVRAERDPAWIADGVVFDSWAPVSPISGRLDAFEWKVPMRHLAQPMNENDIAVAAPAPQAPITEAEVVDIAKIDAEDTEKLAIKPEDNLHTTKENQKETQKQTIEQEKVVLEPANQIKMEPNTPVSVLEVSEDKADLATDETASTPLIDATIENDEQETPPPVRLNVDDPGIEKAQKKEQKSKRRLF